MLDIAPKPENVTWSDEQWQAIAAEGQNILVAAAAGSGKTAVLVERLIRKITEASSPVNIDELLVVTFTEAAAAEMKARIGQAIEEKMADHPADSRLRRQLTLLNHASISTLHAFCMKVLRRYYYKINLDPAFRIMDQTEAELMREQVIEDVFEEEYAQSDNQAFYELVDRYSGDRQDVQLQELVLQLYDFSRSHPQPEQWLDDMAEDYVLAEDCSIDDLSWTSILIEDVKGELQGFLDLINQADELTYQPAGPAPLQENLQQDRKLLLDLITRAETSWSSLQEGFADVSFSRLKTVKGEAYDEDLKDQVKALRDQAKTAIQKMQKTLFSRRPDLYMADIRYMAPHIHTLSQLVKTFSRHFQAVKLEQALLDFSDLEHYCLSVFTTVDEDGKVVTSEAARDYQQQFSEILVDEYQDTNLVQEAIIQHITRSNNLFMVGDVKQSIYRFRLAEPRLFLGKYQSFQKDGHGEGLRIDLARNFRSRQDIITGTNFLFRQIMDETVGEIPYDTDAALQFGSQDYPQEMQQAYHPEMVLIDREEGMEDDDSDDHVDMSDVRKEELEARFIARQIKTLIHEKFEIYDKESKTMRPVTYRDMVVLSRSGKSSAPLILEEFRAWGVPGYAESASGYFSAIEVEVMVALLKIIDNPHQDIPLASVLRSPIVGLDGEALAQIRMADQKADYYDAMLALLKNRHDALYEKLNHFHQLLLQWRRQAHRGSLSSLIWDIFRQTGYYDFVAAMPNGQQRQANLRALYDRARQYEQTSFRGLFRFLRFVDRMQDRGSDLGTARAIGEQEDVVRVMSIHKSKGLEYPVVFLAGMGKSFNMSDTKGSYMLHKTLGFGTKYIDPILRISHPTLPMLAMKHQLAKEMRAEEMRVLYVALTRTREKLYLVGTSKDANKQVGKWQPYIADSHQLLPNHQRAHAMTYLDWIGPALIRHRDSQEWQDMINAGYPDHNLAHDPSGWSVQTIPASELHEQHFREEMSERRQLEEALQQLEQVPVDSDEKQDVQQRLAWHYDYQAATTHMAKQSVSEMKRQRESLTNESASDTQYIRQFRSSIAKRPAFMQASTELSAPERGTVIHSVMQHIDLKKDMTYAHVEHTLAYMVRHELLTEAEKNVVDPSLILTFFSTTIGKRLVQAPNIQREAPFSLMIPASQAYPDWTGKDEDVLVQGVIDCLMIESDGIVLLDYKTDSISDRFSGDFDKAAPLLKERYHTQMQLYRQAVTDIWRQSVKATYLYFFDGGYVLDVS